MPSGKPVDWSLYDSIIAGHLPSMMLKEFTAKYLPHISLKAVDARAKKLGVKPAKQTLSPEHRAAISATMCTETPELVEQIRSLRQTHSIKQICSELRLNDATLWRIINRNSIELTEEGYQRAHGTSATASVGRAPWNKGGELTEETKQKISVAVSGELNGQYGRGMTEEEKERWRASYFSYGIHRIREFLRSPAGRVSLAKTIATIRTIEFREASSKRSAELMRAGKIKGHSNHLQGRHESSKAGRVHYRSSYELRYFKILDTDDSVSFYEVEPLTIEYTMLGVTHNYIPDVLVYYVSGTIRLVEIKPKNLIGTEKNQAKIAAGRAYCGDHEIEFVVITEDNLIACGVR